RRCSRSRPTRTWAPCSKWCRRATGWATACWGRPAGGAAARGRQMAAVKDLYGTLGVSKTASQDEIKKAYRKVARQYHPDANPGDDSAEERFKEVQGAYDVLSDPEKRKQYDRFRSQNARGPGQGGVNYEGFDFGDLGDLGDIFGGLFGARSGRAQKQPRGQPGSDLEVEGGLL